MFGIPNYDPVCLKCPNCGKHDWDEKQKDFQCPNCGYKKTDNKSLPDAKLVYCAECGCHYLNYCDLHQQKQ